MQQPLQERPRKQQPEAAAQEPARACPHPLVSPAYLAELAAANAVIERLPLPGAYHLATGQLLAFHQSYNRAQQCAGRHPPPTSPVLGGLPPRLPPTVRPPPPPPPPCVPSPLLPAQAACPSTPCTPAAPCCRCAARTVRKGGRAGPRHASGLRASAGSACVSPAMEGCMRLPRRRLPRRLLLPASVRAPSAAIPPTLKRLPGSLPSPRRRVPRRHLPGRLLLPAPACGQRVAARRRAAERLLLPGTCSCCRAFGFTFGLRTTAWRRFSSPWPCSPPAPPLLQCTYSLVVQASAAARPPMQPAPPRAPTAGLSFPLPGCSAPTALWSCTPVLAPLRRQPSSTVSEGGAGRGERREKACVRVAYRGAVRGALKQVEACPG